MNTYIALLRGINVGGHKKTPMAELRLLLEKKGLKNVKTYIQSGNVVFQSPSQDKTEIEELIKKSILDYFGFEVPVLVKTCSELQKIVDACPFSEEQKEASYFILLSEAPEPKNIEIANQASYPNEEFHIKSQCVYIYYSLGAGKGKLGVNWFEKKLKIKATARNYRTMAKLIEMTSTP